MSLFDTRLEDLPKLLPLFPVAGALLLPRGNLPLNIFEPRYLNMIEDSLATGRIIGMIQPEENRENAEEPVLYPVGCAGRIIHFEETEDGRFLITLKGICRFRIAKELPPQNGYRHIHPDWSGFSKDIYLPTDNPIAREALFGLLKKYFQHQGIEADLNSLDTAPDERLVNSLAMICPFSAVEKQALLVAPTLQERCDVLKTLLEMATLGDNIITSKQ